MIFCFRSTWWVCNIFLFEYDVVSYLVSICFQPFPIPMSAMWWSFGCCTYVGSATQIQLPVRQIQSIAYNHSFKKRFRCRCFRYFSNSDLNATRIESKTTTEFLESFSEDEFPSKTQEDDHPGTIQSDICRQLNAFYRFSRPHTVIGTVSRVLSQSMGK